MRGDVTYAWNGLAQRLGLTIGRRRLDGLADLAVELCELHLQGGDVTVVRPVQRLVRSLITMVGLQVDHPDD